LLNLTNTSVKTLNFSNVIVEREYVTKKNNRIDLLITTDRHVIGIENKIFSGLYNDLEDYAETIEDISKIENKEPIKIVLSIVEESKSKLISGFINITYRNFIEEIEKNIGNYILEADKIYLIYLMDFIKTLKSFYGGISLEKDKIDFFKKYENKIIELIKEVNDVKNELKKLTYDLGNLIDTKNLEDKYKCDVKRWFYNEKEELMYILVYDINNFLKQDKTIAIDIRVDLNGWSVYSFIRKEKDLEFLKKHFTQNGINYTVDIKQNKLKIFEFDINESLDEIAQEINVFFDKL
jgi:hypothetical protein